MTERIIFTSRQCEQSCRREVAFRRRVYVGLVDRGKMTQERADREIAIMEQITARYKAEADAEGAAAQEQIGQGSLPL